MTAYPPPGDPTDPTDAMGQPDAMDQTDATQPVDQTDSMDRSADVPATAGERTPRDAALAVRDEVGRLIVGQEGVISGLISALLVGGHVLLEGVPGVAKTLTVKALAAALDLEFSRVQFTPDLMPSDVTGQNIYRAQEGTFEFREGPIFTNFLLADEINRTPPKTQAALLEAMEEGQVSVEGDSRPLPEPHIVIATQNPIEYEGTYPLPEAQLDRFLFQLTVGYPTAEQELQIVSAHDSGMNPHDLVASGLRPVANAADLANARAEIASLRVDPRVLEYIVAICRATRDAPSLSLGVSPRGATMLLRAAKAWAWLSGRGYVTPDEIKAIAKPALRHRCQIRPDLLLEGVTVDGILDTVLASTPVPQ